MKFKRVVSKLNRLEKKVEKETNDKYDTKLKHLLKKHGNARRDRDSDLKDYKTKWKDRYNGVQIYEEMEDPDAFQELLKEIDDEHEKEQVYTIGGTQLSTPEKALLRLPPGTSVNPTLSKDTFSMENEILNVKLRYEQKKWQEQDADAAEGIEEYKWLDLDEEEKVRRAEEEASMRQMFDPINKAVYFGKKRVTDSKCYETTNFLRVFIL